MSSENKSYALKTAIEISKEAARGGSDRTVHILEESYDMLKKLIEDSNTTS